jgi:predicted small metal-binding protein
MSTSETALPDGKESGPECDCGYACQGDTRDERLRDGQRHAREVHGIDVTPEQIASGAYERPQPNGTQIGGGVY